MKKPLCVILSLLVLLTLFTACKERREKADTTRGELDLSGFTAADIYGNVLDGDVFSDHTLTMVNVWSLSCASCVRELPALEKLAGSYGDEFCLIGVIFDVTDKNLDVIHDKKEEALETLAAAGVSYTQLIPSSSLKKLCLADLTAFPVTFFIDKNGVIIGEPVLGSKSFDSWKEITDALLEAL